MIGKTIYFNPSERAHLTYFMNADGSKARKGAPNVSPDGKYFVYAKQVKGKWGVYVFNLESGALADRRLSGPECGRLIHRNPF